MTSPIVLRICEECGITPADFFGDRRSKQFIFARRTAIEKLREAGLSHRAIARLIGRNVSTVEYWLLPRSRERRSRYYIRRSLTKTSDHEGIRVLQEIMAEFRIGRKDLAKARYKHCVAVRAIAIHRLGKLGLNLCHIGRLVGCDRATVRYWLKPGNREMKLAQRKIRIAHYSTCSEQRVAA